MAWCLLSAILIGWSALLIGVTTSDVVSLVVVLPSVAWWIATLDLQSTGADMHSEHDDSVDDSSAEEAGPMVSVVTLWREPPLLDANMLATMASKAWNMHIGSEEADSEDGFAVGDEPLFAINTEDGFFLVNFFRTPYFDDVEAVAEEIVDGRCKHAVLSHTAWVSVDAMGVDDPEDEVVVRGIYDKLCRLTAQFTDERCMAVVLPHFQHLVPFTDETDDALLSDDPIDALLTSGNPPVIHVSDDDPRMVAAVEEARSRWSEFVAAFEQRGDDQTFSVKFPLTDGENTEFIWAAVTAIEAETIYGELGNEPVAIRGKAIGDRVRFAVDDLNDWMYEDDTGEFQGGFTVKVLTDAAAEQHGDAAED